MGVVGIIGILGPVWGQVRVLEVVRLGWVRGVRYDAFGCEGGSCSVVFRLIWIG